MAALNLPMDLERIRGFPVLHASIDFHGRGYNAVMGWIQTLDTHAHPSGNAFHLIDKFGAFQDLDTPFNTIGFLPTLFDAPALDALPESRITWRADTFLTVCPDIGGTRRVAYVAGFRWGFDIEAQESRLFIPHVLGATDWDAESAFLAAQCATWTFIRPEPLLFTARESTPHSS